VIRHLGASIRWLLCATVLFGILYPFAIWVTAHLFFRDRAEGSTIGALGRTVGLLHVGQTFSSPKYFFSRPSDAPQGPVLISGGSNLSWSSPLLRQRVQNRARAFPTLDWAVGPDEMIMASASGLDPEISVRAALCQVGRIAKARNISEDEIRALVFQEEQETVLGLFPRRVNVLQLNCLLDALYETAKN
jgi:K+-transporting ATPase ATPase C chain